ncbi:MAG TPA: BON domain-containing protein [Coriobacteriia bacterium]
MKATLATLAAVLAAGAAFAGTDAEVRQRIEVRLAKAGLDKRADISVSVEDGVARLGGIALLYADLREADHAARKEARSVVNLVRVVPETPRSDTAIRSDAQGMVLAWARYGAFDAVAVDVADGVARLRGWVDSPYKKVEVEDRLARVDGLRDVHNDLRVQGFSSGDRRLRSEIHFRIYSDPIFERWAGMPDPPVRVFVEKGRVTLAGTVGSNVEKVTAGAIARGTLAFSVNNQVQVESERPSADRKKDDES